MSGRKVIACSAVAFSAVLAVVVGNRMSAEAMAVVIGVVCGVAASLPMSAFIVALSRRTHSSPQGEPRPQPSPPPIYVLTAGPAPRVGPAWSDYGGAYPPPPLPAPREYRIIGDEPC